MAADAARRILLPFYPVQGKRRLWPWKPSPESSQRIRRRSARSSEKTEYWKKEICKRDFVSTWSNGCVLNL